MSEPKGGGENDIRLIEQSAPAWFEVWAWTRRAAANAVAFQSLAFSLWSSEVFETNMVKVSFCSRFFFYTPASHDVTISRRSS